VPEDVSVVAICPDQLALQASPQLTSVFIPAEEMGRRAVRMVMAQLDGSAESSEPTTTLIVPVLTARDSTAAPPAA
jgi:DNA-binding LacI/PurR family transcriptional regulator